MARETEAPRPPRRRRTGRAAPEEGTAAHTKKTSAAAKVAAPSMKVAAPLMKVAAPPVKVAAPPVKRAAAHAKGAATAHAKEAAAHAKEAAAPDREPRLQASARARRPIGSIPAEEMLERAMAAATPRARCMWARRGLSLRGSLDRTTQSMLLRQLYLSYFEARRFNEAVDVSNQIVELGVLPDVAHQDAARAKQALGDIEGAAGHLRLAARLSPPSRKAFHWWTLGSLYFLAARYEQAISALTRASRWGTTDKPLYQGHLAVAQCASGRRVRDLNVLMERLAEVPAGQGYGRFVLGQMAYYDRRPDEARRYLEAFVRRSTAGRAALAIALDGEIAVAKQLLARIAKS